jgi:hypothetical protein
MKNPLEVIFPNKFYTKRMKHLFCRKQRANTGAFKFDSVALTLFPYLSKKDDPLLKCFRQ